MTQPVVRCPYCTLGEEFRPMVTHVDGRFICGKCGHTTSPLEKFYECRCFKCVRLNGSALEPGPPTPFVAARKSQFAP
jgi:ribosomal protein S27AE